MARLFGGSGSSDRVDFGSAASLDDLDPLTILVWLYPTSLANPNRIVDKGANNVNSLAVFNSAGRVQYLRGRATTGLQYITANNVLAALNTWHFLALTFNSANASLLANIYHGTLAAAATFESSGSGVNGSGAFTSDAASNLYVGNRPSGATQAWGGRIAFVHILAEELSPGEIVGQQFRPHVRPSSRLFSHLGWTGTGSVPDWSGNGNTGTVTGATLADHVPLGPLWPASPFSQDDVYVPPGPGLITASVAARGSVLATVAARGSITATVTPVEP